MTSYVTAYKKSRHVRFFATIEIAIYRLHNLRTNRAPNLRPIGRSVFEILYVLLSNTRTIELENLLRTCIVSAYTLINFLLLMGGAIRTNVTLERFSTKPPRERANSLYFNSKHTK